MGLWDAFSGARSRLQRVVAELERVKAEKRSLDLALQRAAMFDQLTGLPNRDLFADRVRQALKRCERLSSMIGILFIDLDDFRTTNHHYGHDAGDRLLSEVAARLTKTLRGSETAARVGGDDFAVLIEDVHSEDEVLAVARRLIDSLNRPHLIDNDLVYARPHVGVMTTADAEDARTAIRDAESAMHICKASREPMIVFHPQMHNEIIERLSLRNDLEMALTRDEFYLLYQPLVQLSDNSIYGFEALLRWEHPTRGLIPPLTFIPIAEDSDRITQIGLWVIETACRQAVAWQEELSLARPPRMSVNVSGRQLEDRDFVHQVEAILEGTGLPGSYLMLELTESMLLHPEVAMPVLEALKKLGVWIAIDDFGTGYSSLPYLQKFPIDVIKIDRTFVRDIAGDFRQRAVAQAIVKLAKTFDLRSVAEGIETKAQLDVLQGWRCQGGQGFLYARPLPPDEAREHLRRSVIDLSEEESYANGVERDAS